MYCVIFHQSLIRLNDFIFEKTHHKMVNSLVVTVFVANSSEYLPHSHTEKISVLKIPKFILLGIQFVQAKGLPVLSSSPYHDKNATHSTHLTKSLS